MDLTCEISLTFTNFSTHFEILRLEEGGRVVEEGEAEEDREAEEGRGWRFEGRREVHVICESSLTSPETF